MLTVRIPATTANLGPGFDCIGLALGLWNEFTLELAGQPGEIIVETSGEGASKLSSDSQNLVAKTMMDETWPGMLPTDSGIKIRCVNGIPVGSGLGSSSTATLAGLIFASALSAHAVHRSNAEETLTVVRSQQNLDRVLRRAIQIEGHGDNVAPALLGGLVLVVKDEDVIVQQVDFAAQKVVVCVPDFHFLTSAARSAIPAEYSRSQTVFNIGHAMLALDALRRGDLSTLRRALSDRIHEPYRMPLIPGAEQVRTASLAAGAEAACLSGAGPGIIAFATQNHDQIGNAMVDAFQAAGLQSRYWVLSTITSGTEIIARS